MVALEHVRVALENAMVDSEHAMVMTALDHAEAAVELVYIQRSPAHHCATRPTYSPSPLAPSDKHQTQTLCQEHLYPPLP